MPLPIGPIEIANHTHAMTQLVDYPMFKDMMTQLRWMVGGTCGIIVLMVGIMWRGLHVRIGTQRSEDAKKCDDCKQDHDHNKSEFKKDLLRELDALWENVKACCAASGVSPITRKDIGLRKEDD